MKKTIVALILIVAVILLLYSCYRVPKMSFIVDKRAFSNDDIIEIKQLERQFIYKRSFKMPEFYDVEIKIDATFPVVQETSFIASPKKYNIEKIIHTCMGVVPAETYCRDTVEGFQTGKVYSYNGKVLAINNDDSFITFYSETPHISLNESILTESIAVENALLFLKQCDLFDDIDRKPIKCTNNNGSFEITFAKKYYGLFTEYKSYTNFASTQGFPVDGEFITINMTQSGADSFYGLLKEPTELGFHERIISPSAILNQLERYLEQVPFSSGEHLTINDLALVHVATPVKDRMWTSQYVLSWSIGGVTNTNSIYHIYVNAVNGKVIF